MASNRILVVEDEWLVRSTIAEALIEQGYQVAEAETADEAADLLDREAFDVLLTDVRMPGKLDGIELALHARTQNPDLRVLVVSAFATQIAERFAALMQPKTFIPKPYSVEQITQSLQRLLTY